MSNPSPLSFTGERFIPDENSTGHDTTQEHLLRYQASAAIAAGKVVLDAACGEGYGSSLLAASARQVTGLDISEDAIAHARKKYQTQKNTDFVCGSVTRLPFADESFDVVISFETIEHISAPDQALFVSEIKRVLKPDGLLVVSTPNRINYSERTGQTNRFHVKELTPQEFLSILSPLKIHRVYAQSTMAFSSIWEANAQSYRYHGQLVADPADDTFAIVVCGRENSVAPEASLASLSYTPELSYARLRETLVEKERYIAELGSWGKSLDKEIHQMRHDANLLRQESDQLRQVIGSLEQQLERKDIIKQIKRIMNGPARPVRKLIRRWISSISPVRFIQPALFSYQTAGQPIVTRLMARDRSGSAKWPKLQVKIGTGLHKVSPPGDTGASELSFTFKTGAGLKLVHLQALDINSRWRSIGIRLIWAKAKNLLPPPAVLKIQATKFDHKPIHLRACSESPLVSIIIPVYNQWDYTAACLRSILAGEPTLDYEVILADDQSTDQTKNAATWAPGIIISRPPSNLGFLRNCNLAASRARGKFLYFLNNDTQIQPGAITTLIDVFKNKADAGLVGSKLVYPDGRLQEAGGIIWSDASAWNFGRLKDPVLPEFNYLKEADYCSGASLLIPKQLWDDLGGFSDEFAPAYCEDSDLAYKVRAHGLKVYYQPRSLVVHFEGISCGTNTGAGIKAYQVTNTRRFYEKWKETLAAESYPNGHNVFHARDRSRNKRVVLVIDHYVPMPDQDAGSRTMFQFLQMLAACDLNIKFIGANFNYDAWYSGPLQELGIEVLAGVHYRDTWEAWLIENGSTLHAVLLSRPHITESFLSAVKKHCPQARLVYYGHDLHFLREQREHALTNNPESLARSQDWHVREGAILSNIHINLTPSHEEARIVKTHWPDTVSKVVPAWFWRDWPSSTKPHAQRQGFLFVGGFGHTPNVDGIRWLLDEVWPSIRKAIPNAVLQVIGGAAPQEIATRTDPGVIFHGYLSDEALGELYDSSRVALIPLRFGAGVKGKTVEAMRKGLPIVSTSIGIEGLADLPIEIKPTDPAPEFSAQAILLHEDASAWSALQQTQTTYVRAQFSWEKAEAVFKDAFALNS